MTSQKFKQTEIGEIPKDWQIKTLGEVCEISTGKSNTVDAVQDGKYAFFDRSKIIKKSSKYLFDCDAIIIAGEGQTFLPKFYSGKFDLHQRAYALFNFNKEIDIRYVYDYLIHFNKYFERVAVGATAKSLRLRHFQDLPIPIPPLAIQKAIVKILDEVFYSISKSKENAEKNLKNVKELFESYLEEIFSNPEEDWEEKKLGDYYDVRDGTHDSPKYQKTGFPLVTSKNLKEGKLDFQKISLITKEDYDKINSRSNVDKGDVLFAMIGTIGNPVVVKEEPNFAIKNVALFKVSKNQDSDFLKYILDSKSVINKMLSESKGTTQKFVGLGYLRNFKIKIPTLPAQTAIVQKLDALSEQVKQLENIYKQKLKDLEELKKSMLQKAFSGELTKG